MLWTSGKVRVARLGRTVDETFAASALPIATSPNKLRKSLRPQDWAITVVDADDAHHYQPGFIFMPFGTYRPEHVTKSRRAHLNKAIPLIYGSIDRVLPDERRVLLEDGLELG